LIKNDMELITQKICMGKDIGVNGTLFGGIMLAWVDEAASIMAMQVCRTPNIVTLKIDELIFRKKVKEGFMIKIYGEVAKMGNTSIVMNVEARKSSVYSGEEIPVCSTQITFVRIDEAGDPVAIADSVKARYQHLKN